MATRDIQNELPDIAAAAHPDHAGALDWVGMDGIDLPLRYADAQGGTFTAPARVSVQVNLADEHARGIHMSRLYLLLEKSLAEQPLTPASLRDRKSTRLNSSHPSISYAV